MYRVPTGVEVFPPRRLTASVPRMVWMDCFSAIPARHKPGRRWNRTRPKRLLPGIRWERVFASFSPKPSSRPPARSAIPSRKGKSSSSWSAPASGGLMPDAHRQARPDCGQNPEVGRSPPEEDRFLADAALGGDPGRRRETWGAIRHALLLGHRGLPGGDTLYRLLQRERGRA